MTPPTLPQFTVKPKVLDMLQTRVTVVHSVAMVTEESPCMIRGAAEITSIMTNRQRRRRRRRRRSGN